MSQDHDDIVFDEIRYREPHKFRRPDRDRRWICASYEVPLPVDLPIFLDLKTADTIERHALRDTSVELGGILLGKECIDDLTGELFVWVTQSLEAKHYENTQASFTYTHDSWEEITRERDLAFPDLDIVGWYHTHPDFGVFLSSHDLFIHRNFFGQPLQLAYVVDPIRQTRNFFQWRDGRMEPVGGFWITAERGDRVRLARLVNDLENIAETPESAAISSSLGSSLTPRLEAELIAMLSRPNLGQQTAYRVDQTQTALLFSVLGAVAGIFGLGLVLWLNQLSTAVYQQTQTLTELERFNRETTDRQRILLDTALSDAPMGKSPDKFLEQYNRAAVERDQLRKLLADRTAINDTLGAQTKHLTESLESLKADQVKLKAQADDAKETTELRTKLDKLERENEEKTTKIEEYEKTLETAEGRKALELRQSYEWTWYAAVSGWGLSLILGLILLAGYAFLNRVEPEREAEPEPPSSIPPIQIN